MQDCWPWVSALLGIAGGAVFCAAKLFFGKWRAGRKKTAPKTGEGAVFAPFGQALPLYNKKEAEESELFSMLNAVERYDGGKVV